MAADTAELEKYHNWLLRSTMKVAFNAAPDKRTVLDSLQGGAKCDDDDKGLYEDLEAVAAAQRAVLSAMAKPLVDLDLDRGATA